MSFLRPQWAPVVPLFHRMVNGSCENSKDGVLLKSRRHEKKPDDTGMDLAWLRCESRCLMVPPT
jgi:hypothetical protein